MADEADALVEPDPDDPLEIASRIPTPIDRKYLNPRSVIPHGCTSDHVYAAMGEFVDFLGFINTQMATRDIPRFETMLMPANFSSMVGEFMSTTIPKYCKTIVKNEYHNGHPDLVPKGMYPGDSALHEEQGIEIKGSRYDKGWQGHNPENTWLMVFVFASNRPVDAGKGVSPFPFRFRAVYGAELSKADWSFAGRSETSRRTITATVLPSGYAKMRANWIYLDPRAG